MYYFFGSLFHQVPAAESARRNVSVGDANAKEVMEKFEPLKVVLEAVPAVYENHEVRRRPLSQNSPLTNIQRSTAVGDKIDVLFSHIVVLEKYFDSPPSDVAELRRRDGLIQYDVVPSLWAVLTSF